MSNLLFLPAIIVAIYQRFYVEALVYFYTMSMSTVRQLMVLTIEGFLGMGPGSLAF